MINHVYGENVQIDIRDNPMGFGLGAMMYRLKPDGNLGSIAEPLTFTELDQKAASCFPWKPTMSCFPWKPTMVLEYDVPQKLMDALWQHGVRPSSEGTEGQFAAQNAHFQDMRRIAFAALKTAGVTVREDADGSGFRYR